MRAQKEIGRSSYGGIFVWQVTRPATRRHDVQPWNRAYGLDANWQLSEEPAHLDFVARTDTPETAATRWPRGSDYSCRGVLRFPQPGVAGRGRLHAVGEQLQPRGRLPAAARLQPARVPRLLPAAAEELEWIRRFAPHISSNAFWDLNGACRPRSRTSIRSRSSRCTAAASAGSSTTNKDNPLPPFVVYNRDGNRVVIPPAIHLDAARASSISTTRAPRVTGTIRYRIGNYYDGDFNAIELTSDYRFTARFTASVGWTRQDVDLPYGSFVTNLVPVKASYSFTNLASLSALVQYNGQTGAYSSNIRLALLNRSGTGLFVVYNDRRDVLDIHVLRHRGTIVRREVPRA